MRINVTPVSRRLRMDARRRIFPITRSLFLGPFASPERRSALADAGVTHLLNVGEAPSVLLPDGVFREVEWHPIVDLERIPDEAALRCLDALHRMVCQPAAAVYVHCMAGWNRSPTILWLYLVGCGVDEREAKGVIEARAWDAVPAHLKLVDPTLVETIRRHGLRFFQPHPRPESLSPAAAA